MSDETPETYEEYTVYVDSGADNDKFRELMRTIESAEISWKDTHDV